MRTQTLAKSNVIRRRDEFESLFTTGKRRSGRFVTIIYLPLTQNTISCKAAFVVGRKLGDAVYRNRYRRRLREIFRKNKDRFKGWRVLLVALPAIRTASLADIGADVLSTTERLA